MGLLVLQCARYLVQCLEKITVCFLLLRHGTSTDRRVCVVERRLVCEPLAISVLCILSHMAHVYWYKFILIV